MLNEKIREAIQSLDYSNLPFAEVTEKLYYEGVMEIVSMNDYKQENEIIDALPERIRFLYYVLWLQTETMNDGFLSIFYNHSVFEVKRFLETVKTAGLPICQNWLKKPYRLSSRSSQCHEKTIIHSCRMQMMTSMHSRTNFSVKTLPM